jgi:hypothetical protein
MENAIRRIAFHMECSPRALGQIVIQAEGQSEVLPSLSHEIRRKNRRTHGTEPPSLESSTSSQIKGPSFFARKLKGHLDYRMCLEWFLSLVITH